MVLFLKPIQSFNLIKYCHKSNYTATEKEKIQLEVIQKEIHNFEVEIHVFSNKQFKKIVSDGFPLKHPRYTVF